MKTKTPKPDEIHYTAKIPSHQTTTEAVKYWLTQAHRAMLYLLCEEIDAGQIKVGSDWWKAQIHRRALEMIDVDEEIRPAYVTAIWQAIEDNALYHHAGYESAEEWFASESSLRKGGLASNLRWWANTLIPWCKANDVFESDEAADRWFLTPQNQDGLSRTARLRDVTPDLRRVVENDDYELSPDEQKTIVTNILKDVADHTLPREELKKKINGVRQAKPVIQIYKNGDDSWHVLEFDLDQHQYERFCRQNRFSAIIEIVESP